LFFETFSTISFKSLVVALLLITLSFTAWFSCLH